MDGVFVYTVAHMITAWEGLLKDAVKMQRQLMKNATVVFAFIEVRTNTVYAVIFKGLVFHERKVCKDFHGLIFADQVAYIASLSYWFFLRISHSANLQGNPQMLHPTKITAHVVSYYHNNVYVY